MTPNRIHRAVESACRKRGIEDPLDLPSPTLDLTPLSKILKKRGAEHRIRDKERRLNSESGAYHNGALFGNDPEIPPEELDSDWHVQVLPDEEYLEKPGLAGSAWLHTERRHRGGSS